MFHIHDINDKFLGFIPCLVLSISNGYVDYDGINNQLQPRDIDPDTVATYNCNGDYILQGEMKRTCGRDGQWSGKKPECKPTHCLFEIT